MSNKDPKRPHGQLRQSQVVTTFGPGAMIDLPQYSVLVSGLDYWGDPVAGGYREILEERLVGKLQKLLGREDVRLFAPPVDVAAEEEPKTGIRVWQFPDWFLVRRDQPWGQDVRSRRIVHRRQLIRGRFVDDGERLPVVPMRFVQACTNGHLDDINWTFFVHGHTQCQRTLWLDERGTSGDLSEIFVRCECQASRILSDALPGPDRLAPLGFCNGARPWLGWAPERCGGAEGKPQINRLLVRSASNAYFTQILSVIHIPEADQALREAVDRVWPDFLLYVEEFDDLVRERRKARVEAHLKGHDNAQIFAEIQRRKSGASKVEKKIKHAELETLMANKPVLGEDAPETDFYATALPLDPKRRGPMAKIERVVLIHRLREVVAQLGFTRFEPAVADIDGELALDVQRAAIAKEASWLPAIENRGEGFFVGISAEALEDWLGRATVLRRVDQLSRGYAAWAKARQLDAKTFPGPRYVLLHSLSHLLISAVSLAAGYAASSIKERIYVGDQGAGILLYTGTPDAEGTLGGLVEVGRHIGTHLRTALELGTLCSNDPVCAQHQPDSPWEERYLHGAACHGCLLIAEPSCERRNELLDRALVVPTVDAQGAEFFDAGDL